MRHSITEQFIVHLVRVESLGKSSGHSRHVFEEAFPVLVCKLVELFVMPFEGEERVASKELVWVELSNGNARFKKDQVGWFAKALTDPTVRFQLCQGRPYHSERVECAGSVRFLREVCCKASC